MLLYHKMSAVSNTEYTPKLDEKRLPMPAPIDKVFKMCYNALLFNNQTLPAE
jgi:hypothetical protein